MSSSPSLPYDTAAAAAVWRPECGAPCRGSPERSLCGS